MNAVGLLTSKSFSNKRVFSCSSHAFVTRSRTQTMRCKSLCTSLFISSPRRLFLKNTISWPDRPFYFSAICFSLLGGHGHPFQNLVVPSSLSLGSHLCGQLFSLIREVFVPLSASTPLGNQLRGQLSSNTSRTSQQEQPYLLLIPD